LTPGLNATYGPNGMGKTSLAEALEWLFLGITSKLHYAKSKTEFRNSLRNLHFDGPHDPFVEVDLLFVDGSRYTVRRELVDDNNFRLFINGETVENLSLFKVHNGFSTIPVVAQHALREFIHSEPVKRWGSLSKMLHLDTVSDFRNTLTSAITKFKNINTQTLETIIDIASSLKGKPSLSSFAGVAKALETYNRTKFKAELNRLTAELLGTLPREPLAALQRERKGMKAEFVAVSQMFKEAASSKTFTNDDPRKLVGQIVQAVDGLITSYPQYLALHENQLLVERIELLKQGLALTTDNDLCCPLCGEPTMTIEKKAALHKEVIKHTTILSLYIKSRDELQTISNLFPRLIKTVRGVVPELVPEASTSIERLVGTVPNEIIEDLQGVVSKIEYLNVSFDEFIRNNLTLVSDLQQDFTSRHLNKKHLEDIVTHISDITVILDTATQLTPQVDDVQAKVLPFLERKAIGNENVEKVDALISLWRSLIVIEEGFVVQSVIQRMSKLKKGTEEFEKELTEARLLQKEAEILKWYSTLNPNEDIRFARMGITSSGARQIDLVAELFGKAASAAAMLSESHINATGLSVYLGQIISTYSPFKFIVLDDPVQSMDADHMIRFQTNLVGELLSMGYQVIILSHLRVFTEELRLQHDPDCDSHYEFASYHLEGPRVMERGPSLQEYIRQADTLKKGGSEQRITAAHMLRKALERMCKMAYSKATEIPISNKYLGMTSSQLKELVKGIISTEDIGKVSQILRYGDQASHDEQRMEPPTRGGLDSLIDQLTNLIKKYVDSTFNLKSK
jgi:hypothetical protein